MTNQKRKMGNETALNSSHMLNFRRLPCGGARRPIKCLAFNTLLLQLNNRSFFTSPVVSICMQGLKVLIVEDDGDMRGLYCFLLANEGCQVKAVRNGLEAMTEIEANRPDVVVTDIAMPI